MRENLRDYHLGIIGGCLSHQSDIALSQLYHRQLATKLLETSGIRLQVHIARDFEQIYSDRLNLLKDVAHLDGILLHLRIIFTRKASILSRHVQNDVETYYLHPFLLRRHQHGWADVETANFKNCLRVTHPKGSKANTSSETMHGPRIGRRVFGFRLRDMNLILGTLLRLDEWAINDEIHMLRGLVQACQARNLPLFVLGPTPFVGSYWVARLIGKMNERLDSFLASMRVPFCPINDLTDEDAQLLLRPDGLHLNEDGHSFVAKRLAATLEPWFASEMISQISSLVSS
jgi:hypothetical protein